MNKTLHKFSPSQKFLTPVKARVAKVTDSILPFEDYGLPSHQDLNSSIGSLYQVGQTGTELFSGGGRVVT
ncbi:MAG: hypothetical protein JKY94_00990 [Rhodobacteraceae bacterium]|nr:hypothetical protein [Paracoccaceae bacterium]